MGEKFRDFMTIVSGVTSFLMLAMISFGYFVYGGIHGAFGMVVYLVYMDLAALAGLIPVVGIFVADWLMEGAAIAAYAMTGIGPSWLTSVVYYYCYFMAGICWMLTTIFFVLFLIGFRQGWKRQNRNRGRKPPKEYFKDRKSAKDLEAEAGIKGV